MTTPIPGCSNCAKTSSGGRTLNVGPNRVPRYQIVSKDGAPIGKPWSSVTAAATFLKGHVGATVVDLGVR